MKNVFDNNPDIFLITAVMVCVTAVCIVIAVLICRWKTVRTFESLNNMIDDVIKDSFNENTFDESRMSALESKFANYLLSSKLSARNVAEERNKIKELITDISHQTKTPIANIILYSELLLENCQDDEERKNMEALYQQAQKLSFLISSLVKLSRLETGIIAVSPNRKNVCSLLSRICHQYQPLAEQKGLYMNVEGQTADSSAYMAKFDEKWTAEAVGNIVDNAIKYTENGGITITIKPYELFCCIEISDTGVGIPEEELSQVFKRFYRSQSVSQTQGIGIGLYLAREIIAAENGYIKVLSRHGIGTRFCVYLPK